MTLFSKVLTSMLLSKIKTKIQESENDNNKARSAWLIDMRRNRDILLSCSKIEKLQALQKKLEPLSESQPIQSNTLQDAALKEYLLKIFGDTLSECQALCNNTSNKKTGNTEIMLAAAIAFIPAFHQKLEKLSLIDQAQANTSLSHYYQTTAKYFAVSIYHTCYTKEAGSVFEINLRQPFYNQFDPIVLKHVTDLQKIVTNPNSTEAHDLAVVYILKSLNTEYECKKFIMMPSTLAELIETNSSEIDATANTKRNSSTDSSAGHDSEANEPDTNSPTDNLITLG